MRSVYRLRPFPDGGSSPEFQDYMHQLLREHVASLQLSMIALTGEAITHLRYLVNGFSDEISLKACQ